MTAPVASPGFYADLASLGALRRGAQEHDPQALRAVAQQFESLVARMMISSMRAASFGDSLFGSDQHEFYQSLFDDQLAVELTRGRGLGLADLLIEQLMRAGLVPSAEGTPAPEAAPESEAAGPVARRQWQPASREEFVRDLWQHAQRAGRELGIDPRALIAQAALETGWGQAIPRDAQGGCSFNLFGIKAGPQWKGPAVGVSTLEFENGLPVRRTERFRAYESVEDGFRDYVELIRGNPRYAAALGCGADIQAFASVLQQGGYATDPLYAEKLAAVAASLESLEPDVLKLADEQPIT